MSESPLLFFDIENSPNTVHTWGVWEQNAIKVVQESYLLSFSAKWLGGEHITKGLSDYKLFKSDPKSDEALIKEIWDLFNKAEIIIAHNAKFDIKKTNARFLYYGLKPPSPYKVIDTLTAVKAVSSENYNKLDSLGEKWGLGRKLEHEGFPLWERCMQGDRKAFEKMKRYNKQDVVLLEKVYLHLRPFIANHPNVSNLSQDSGCPRCLSKNLMKDGLRYTNTGVYQKLRCKSCGGPCRAPVKEEETLNPLRPI